MPFNIPTNIPNKKAHWILITSGRTFNKQLCESVVECTRESTISVGDLREALKDYPADTPIYLHGGAGARCFGSIQNDGF